MRTCTHKLHARSGLSLVEVVLVASVLGVLTRALILTSDSLGRITSTGNTRGVLQAEADSANREVIADLRRSGIFLGTLPENRLNGKAYPYLFDNGAPDDADFDDHAHAPADSEAEAGERDFGDNREIVFVLPSDLDGDGRPELDANLDGVPELDGNRDGEYTDDAADTAGFWDPNENGLDDESRVSWSFDEISFVVNTAPDGINYLERRVNGGDDGVRRIAKYVERVVFEDAWDTNFDIPGDAVRMRLFLRKRTPEGVLMRYESEIWVSMRNGAAFVDPNGGGN